MGYFNAIDSLCQIIYLVILLISSDKETFFDRQLMEYMTTIFLFNFVAVFIFKWRSKILTFARSFCIYIDIFFLYFIPTGYLKYETNYPGEF